VRAAGGTLESRLPESWLVKMMASKGENFIGFWEAMVRQELRADPFLLERSAERASI
jgi:L-ribulose-5-phosphate 4-epimerase